MAVLQFVSAVRKSPFCFLFFIIFFTVALLEICKQGKPSHALQDARSWVRMPASSRWACIVPAGKGRKEQCAQRTHSSPYRLAYTSHYPHQLSHARTQLCAWPARNIFVPDQPCQHLGANPSLASALGPRLRSHACRPLSHTDAGWSEWATAT